MELSLLMPCKVMFVYLVFIDKFSFEAMPILILHLAIANGVYYEGYSNVDWTEPPVENGTSSKIDFTWSSGNVITNYANNVWVK